MASAIWILNRVEKIQITNLNLGLTDAKIDSGAYHSSIYARNIHIKNIDGVDVLMFNLFENANLENKEKTFKFKKFEKYKIVSSNGEEEERFGIKLRIKWFNNIEHEKTIFTLSDRETMKYPILIGRKSIPSGYVIDVNKLP